MRKFEAMAMDRERRRREAQAALDSLPETFKAGGPEWTLEASSPVDERVRLCLTILTPTGRFVGGTELSVEQAVHLRDSLNIALAEVTA